MSGGGDCRVGDNHCWDILGRRLVGSGNRCSDRKKTEQRTSISRICGGLLSGGMGESLLLGSESYLVDDNHSCLGGAGPATTRYFYAQKT